MALSKDDETAKLIQVQVDELHKMNINSAEKIGSNFKIVKGKYMGKKEMRSALMTRKRGRNLMKDESL